MRIICSSIGTWKWLSGRINSASPLYHRRVHDSQSLCSYIIMELTQHCRGRCPFSVSDIGSLYNLNAINIHDCQIQRHAGKYQRIGGHLNSQRLSTPTLSDILYAAFGNVQLYSVLWMSIPSIVRGIRGYEDVGPFSPGVGVALRRHRTLSRT